MQTYNRDWRTYNQRLVNRGREITLFIRQEDTDWKEELKKMNKGKRGSPYEYPNTLIYAGMVIKCLHHKGYRQLEGYLLDIALFLKFNVPDFRTFWWRINEMEKEGVRFNPTPKGKKIDVAVDSTGIKLVNDGEYRTKKYKKKKSWAKFHTAVNEETGESLTVVITKDNVGDQREFKKVMAPIVDITNKVDTDKGYDSEESFEYCAENNITPGIPVRINATGDRQRYRKRAVQEQFGFKRRRGAHRRYSYPNKRKREANQKAWKESINHGYRWFVEGFYSRFKGTFGEYVFSKKREMVEKEIVIKTNLLNKFIVMDR